MRTRPLCTVGRSKAMRWRHVRCAPPRGMPGAYRRAVGTLPAFCPAAQAIACPATVAKRAGMAGRLEARATRRGVAVMRCQAWRSLPPFVRGLKHNQARVHQAQEHRAIRFLLCRF